jgi:hypothetical protein
LPFGAGESLECDLRDLLFPTINLLDLGKNCCEGIFNVSLFLEALGLKMEGGFL